MNENKMVCMTEKEIITVINFIEEEFFDVIRKDASIDGIDWAVNLMSALQKLREAKWRNVDDLCT